MRWLRFFLVALLVLLQVPIQVGLLRLQSLMQETLGFDEFLPGLGVLLDKKACQLDEAGASDPAELARIYTEAADMQTFAYGDADKDVLRCRQRAAELAGN